MKIAIDIDGTLCWCNLPVFLQECNTTFDLKIAPATLAKITSKQEFYALPEVQAARARNAYIDDELAWIEYREKCILESLLIDDAVAGVARLAQFGEIEYYTARYCDQPEIQQEIEKSTRQWLEQYHFVNSYNVVFCDQIYGKILSILKLAEKNTIILVDDSYKSVIREIKQLGLEQYNLLLNKCTLVAMRATQEELPATELNVIALPYWDEIESIVEKIQPYAKTETTETTRDTQTTKATRNAKAVATKSTRYRKTAPRQEKT